MNQLKDIRNIIIAVLLGYVIFLQQCNTHTCPDPNENTVTREITKTVIDTIPFNYPVAVKVRPEIPEPQIVYIDSTRSFKSYNKEFEDSLIKGNMFTEIEDGGLVNWGFDYKPKFPKYITKEVTITNTIEAKKHNLLFLTASIGGNTNQFYTDFGLSLYQKKGYLYGASYDPVNKAVKVNMGLQLNNRK